MDLDFSDEVIEKLLLKRALVDKSWVNTLAKIYDKRWFKVQNLGLVVKLIINYYNKYSAIPSNKVIQALVQKSIEKTGSTEIKVSDVSQLLTEVSSLNMNLDPEIESNNIREFIRRNAFYNAMFDNAEILEQNPENYKTAVDKCLENFTSVERIAMSETNLGMDYFNEKDMEEHWQFIRNPEAKIKTGWDSLDEYTNGGFLKDGKMLALFMAQAGLGKSVFLSNLAVNCLKQNLNVAVISLEMSEDVYACRFDSHISYSDINKLKENEKTAIERIKAFHAKYPSASLFVKEYPPRSVSTSDIEQYLENLKNLGKKIDVIIVDYLNLVLPKHKTDSMFKDGLAVSEELRGLSYKFHAPVISAVQCNTEGMQSADIDMQNVSESRGIVHTVDALFALYQLDEDRKNGIINLKIVKNRLGGMIGKHSQFTLNPETLSLTDVTFDQNFAVDEEDESEISKIVAKIPQITADLGSL